MKKGFIFLIVTLLTMSMALPCYASEAFVDDKDDVVIGDVFAKYVCTTSWSEVEVTNGMAEIETDGGYTVSVSGASQNAARLVVFQITSTEDSAWTWLSSCIDTNHTLLNAFDIYFEDADGNRINANDVQIRITKCEDKSVVFAVNIDGQSTKLNSAYGGNSISFSANGSNYYVLASMNSPTEPTDPDEPVSPPTGDDSQIMIWFLLATVSGVMLLVVLLAWRKYNRR